MAEIRQIVNSHTYWQTAAGIWVPATPTTPLPVTMQEIGLDSGVATGGSDTTLVDTAKDWEVDMWADAILEVDIDGVEYHRTITVNADDTLTFNALPAGVVVSAGDTYSIRRVVSLLSPLAKAAIFNQALPAIGVNWLGADITPTNSPSYLRIYLTVAIAGTLSVVRTVGVPVVEQLNHGVALVTNCAYMFDVEWRTGDGLNFRYSATGANILVFRADEIGAAAA
ncbi:unnamed protein product [marine sediment metagenome]|uniref:Uncharacterized protein n=1 Tax=marine sediment metagenome TaxID=412755 RepID=X1LAQ4_9ZZZZ